MNVFLLIKYIEKQNSIFSTPKGLSTRLIGGNGHHEGNVEILVDGKEYRVCDDEWDENDASVICNMLGYT